MTIALRRQLRLPHVAGQDHQPQRAAVEILRRRQHARGDIAVIHQAVLQGAHQQVNALRAQTFSLRLAGDAAQRQPVRQRLLPLQLDARDRKTGFFNGKVDASEAGNGRRKPHVGRLRFDLLLQRLLALLLLTDLFAGVRKRVGGSGLCG